MAGLTPGKIVLLAVSVVAISVSLFYVMRDTSGVTLADEIVYVDVTTGEMFYIPYGRGTKGGIIPETHPDTGEATLFRVEKNENDEWRLVMRYASMYSDLFDPSVVLDSETGELAPASGSPKRLR